MTPLPTNGTEEQEFEYGDLKRITCYLCSRQLKTLDQLRRHNAESDLHKKNLQDLKLRDVAKTKALAAHEAANPSAAAEEPDTSPKYRDRALERRVIYGQPDIPAPPSQQQQTAGESSTVNLKRKFASSAAGPPAPSPPPLIVHPGDDDNNVGNKLLKKMGWAAGTGLGVSGEGRVAPIETAMFASRAGLGASKGKDISGQIDPFNYTASVKDSARERYGPT